MSEVLNNIKTRRSIRKYTSEEVSDEIIEKIVEAGTYAPSAMNRQSAVIVAVKNKEIRDQLARMNAEVMNGKGDPFYGAPVVLIVLGNADIPTYVYDGSIVMQNLMLAANDLGLGSCWIHRAEGMFKTEEGQALLKSWGIEGNYVGVANCIIGYPDEKPEAKPRKENYVYYVR